MNATQTLDQLLTRPDPIALAELHAYYDRLDAVDADFMLGSWSGGVFRTGHPGEQQLSVLGWIGKDFLGSEEVHPIVCRGADGQRQVSDVLGQARLRMMVYRGALTATMVYDRHPVADHFKKIDEHTVLGVMDKKADAFPLYFYLRRAG